MEPPQQGQLPKLVDRLIDILSYMVTIEIKGLGRLNFFGMVLITIVVIFTGLAVVALDATGDLDIKGWHFVAVIALFVLAWLACVGLLVAGIKAGTRLWDE